MKKIRIAVMGCASIAERLVIPAILQLPDHFELVAIGSRTKDKAVDFTNRFGGKPVEGYDNLFNESFDAVYMPLPTGIHEEWITKCLLAGKHVLCEKSLATDADSALRMVNLARRQELLLMENFMFRYHSQHQFVWQQLQQHTIGDLRLFRSQFGFPPLAAGNFRYDPQQGGGALLDAGAYTVKAAQWFLGNELKVASANLFMDETRGVDLYGNATLVNQMGQTAQVSFGFDNYYQCNYEFWGSKGRMFAERAFTPKPAEQPAILLEKSGSSERMLMEADNHFVNILREWHRAIAEKDFSTHWEEVILQSRLLTEIKQNARYFSI